MTANEAERYLGEGQFPPGSMGPRPLLLGTSAAAGLRP
jgi:carbamate kinase